MAFKPIKNMFKAVCPPLLEEIDTGLSPVALFELFKGEPYSFWLDSGMDPQKLGRFSCMGSRPFLVLKSKGEEISVIQGAKTLHLNGNPLDILDQYLNRYRIEVTDTHVPLMGGAIGFFSYDLCHFIERLPSQAVDDLQLSESCLGFYDLILVFDHLTGKTFIVSTGFPEMQESRRIRNAADRLSQLKSKIFGLSEKRKMPESGLSGHTDGINLSSNFTHQDYIKAVDRARQYIIEGDIFEVNLSQRFETNLACSPYELYLRLRNINPAPFAAYLDFEEMVVASSSPERFLRCQGDLVEARPIKGTIRRGETPEEDRANAAKLLSSVKDRAENMMIVDLERNDLGRVCRYGTVEVTELAILERYPTVFHLTSTIKGRLREGVGRIDLLKATFPGGSITGAPKVRSMEIIDELEPTRRSIYTGCIGYISFDGTLDLNIVIRTFIIKGNKVYFQAGGAIVYDSDPESEYRETLDKVRALVGALQGKEDDTYYR